VLVSRPTPRSVVLQVGGEIDMQTSAILEDALRTELDAAPHDLMVDLAGVTFLASSGLAVLIRAAGEAADRDIRLTLIAQHRAVLRPLEVTRTSDRFRVLPTLDAALTELKPESDGNA
jgi:anti-sigma B factor antagonist